MREKGFRDAAGCLSTYDKAVDLCLQGKMDESEEQFRQATELGQAHVSAMHDAWGHSLERIPMTLKKSCACVPAPWW